MAERASHQSSTGTMVLNERGMNLLSNLEEEIVKTGDRDLIDRWTQLGVNVVDQSGDYIIVLVGGNKIRLHKHKEQLTPFRSKIRRYRRYMVSKKEAQEKLELTHIISEFEKALDSADQRLDNSIATARDLNTKMTNLSQDIRRSLESGRRVLGG